jgi:hypothetical protein
MPRQLIPAAFLCCATIVAACADRDGEPATDTAVTGEAAGSLERIAGRWDMRIFPETGDSTLGTFVLNATADTTGWTITAPNRQPVPLRVIAVQGDSIITEAGPYESFLRPGRQVRTRGVMRLQGDRLVGRTEARYQTPAGDSVARVRTEGTRAPR